MKKPVIDFVNGFVKVTAWPAERVVFNPKIYYEDRKVQGRRIRGKAIIISNHTSVFDYAAYLFVFYTRTCRYQMAEVLFEKKKLSPLLKLLGGIRVDRNSKDMGFVAESLDILEKGGVVGIFPESRIPRPGEERPLPFKTSAAYIALASGAPVIPVVTNGSYFTTKRARILIGTPMDVSEFTDPALTDRENLEKATSAMRDRIVELKKKLDAKEP